ncbi:MAG: hypothetical protein GY820_34305, partial [Gammaproteobacteria bacterium]|nr:hypothetical protein [Gammaproteobacteria bacterium]
MVEWIRAQSAKIQNSPQEEWENWVKIAHRQHQKGASSSQNQSLGNPSVRAAPSLSFGGSKYPYAGNSYGENGPPDNSFLANVHGGDTKIYSQVPYQPEQSRLEDIFQHLSMQMDNVDQKVSGIDQKVTGVDQRVAKIEQKRSQSQTPPFRLSYAEGNVPMKNEKKLYSSPNQSLAKGVQGTHSAVSNLVENKQQSSDYYGGKEQTSNC